MTIQTVMTAVLSQINDNLGLSAVAFVFLVMVLLIVVEEAMENRRKKKSRRI